MKTGGIFYSGIARSPSGRARRAFGTFLIAALVALLCSPAVAQIRMAIEVTPNEPVPGELVVVRVTVANAGASAVGGLRVELPYPDGLFPMSDALFSDAGDCTVLTNGSACNPGETALWDIGTLPPGAGKTVYMSPLVDDQTAAGTMIPFDGEVFENTESRAIAGAEAVVVASRPLDLDVDADGEPVEPGETLGLELTFGNNSGTATTGTELRFPLPAGTSLVEAGGGTLDGNEVVWDLGILNPGDSGQRRVAVQLDGSLANGDLVEVDAAEISGQRNAETTRTRQQATTRVQSASQLAFSIDMPAQPLRTDVLSPIRLTVTNRSDTAQSGVRAALFFPPGLGAMSDVLLSDGGDCTFLTASSSCNPGETASWDVGTLPAGASKTVYMSPFALSSNDDGRVLAFFGRAFSDATPDFWAHRSLAVEADRSLELEVDADRDPAAAGETLAYTLTFGNAGNAATTANELRFPLPAGTSPVELGGGTLDGDAVVWDLGTLNPGDSGKRRVEVQLGGDLNEGDLIEVDAAEINGQGQFFQAVRVRQQATTRVQSAAQLAFSIDMPADPLRTGVFSPIHLSVTNRSDTLQSGVRAELFFPPGLGAMSDSLFSDGGDCTFLTSSSSCNPGETAAWDIGTLPPGAGKTVTLSPFVLPASEDGRVLTFFGRAFADATPDFWQHRSPAVEAGRALELEVNADPEPVAPGETLEFALDFGNRSGTATADSQLRFPLPAGTTLVEAVGGTLIGGEVVWSLGTLNPGDSGTRRVSVQLDAALDDGDLIEVAAAEISGESNFEVRRTRQQATTRVETASQLAFAIDMPAAPLRTGVFSPVHLTVTNRSETVQSGVRAELFFPPGLGAMADSLFSDGGDCTFLTSSSSCNAGETAFWDIGTLPPGAGRTLTLVPFAQNANPDGSLLSFFGRAFANATPDFWVRRSLALEAARALELEFDADREPVVPGETLGYTLTFGNAGSAAAANTELRFALPPETGLIEADGGGMLVGDEVVWNLGTLEAGGVGRRTVELAPDDLSRAGDIVRGRSARLLVDGSTAVTNDAPVPLRAGDDFDFTLSLFPNIAQPEQAMAADLVVFNQAPFDITNVELQLYFPAGLLALGDGSIPDDGDCSFLTSSFSCNPGESVFWQLGTMPGTTQQMRMIEPTLADLAEGSLVNFFARIRSDSTIGAFVKRTLPVGNFAPPPEPGIALSGNGQPITNGSTTPDPANGTDFGTADIDNDPRDQVFVITNPGVGALELTGSPRVAITGPQAAEFILVAAPPATIEAGQSAGFTIRFQPDNLGPRQAAVAIENNVAGQSPWTFGIGGEGLDATGQLMFKDGFE